MQLLEINGNQWTIIETYMSRYYSSDEIAELDDLIKKIEDDENTASDILEAHELLIGVLFQTLEDILESQGNPQDKQWVSVRKDLPSVGEPVEIYGSVTENYPASNQVGILNKSGRLIQWLTMGHIMHEVTHWRPLTRPEGNPQPKEQRFFSLNASDGNQHIATLKAGSLSELAAAANKALKEHYDDENIYIQTVKQDVLFEDMMSGEPYEVTFTNDDQDLLDLTGTLQLTWVY